MAEFILVGISTEITFSPSEVFSPYKDKKIGEFFIPVTTRAMTEIGINYKDPF